MSRQVAYHAFMSGSPLPAIPLVGDGVDAAALASAFEEGFPLEFCAAESFDPDFLASLVREGFIPMATAWEDGRELLLPKLHLVRSCLDPRGVRITRTARREARGLVLSAGCELPRVIASCLEMHGDDWLRPPLVDSFLELGRRGIAGGFGLLSFELWREDRLVAGEFGALVGACYTSWSGFRLEDGAGTVQLVATARALARAGITMWDLGMPLPYKAGLGAGDFSRARFLADFRRARGAGIDIDFSFLPGDARRILDCADRVDPDAKGDS